MSLFGTLNTSISGMAAQANKLGTIGDNIANASTTGYKRASTEFETLLGNASTSAYQSGGVLTQVRYGISEQGSITGTSSATDLAIQGNGFFVVQDSSGGNALTRAGSFVPNTSGNLVNTAGYKLMGYSLANGASTSGTAGLQLVNISSAGLAASPSTTATLSVNVPSAAATVAAANLPSANTSASTYTSKTSLVAYDNLGTPVTLDIYMSKSGVDASGNPQWEVSVFNAANASASGSFPYGTSGSAAMATSTLTFNKTTGSVLSGGTTSVAIPNGGTIAVNLGASTQLAAAFSVNASTIDGSSPSTLEKVVVGKDGTITQVYSNGIQKATYKVALATVQSPDKMTPGSGDVFTPNSDSGSMVVNTPLTNGLGQIDSSSLEDSTVDLATELTNMISAQRGYEANSKVLQTTSDLLGVLNNIHT